MHVTLATNILHSDGWRTQIISESHISVTSKLLKI